LKCHPEQARQSRCSPSSFLTSRCESLLVITVADDAPQFYPTKRKLIYCSRTVPEIEKALAELKRLMEYREEMGAKDEGFRGLGLTSRRNLCLHPTVRDGLKQLSWD
jgi:DNA excision repair protein ERCC-2